MAVARHNLSRRALLGAGAAACALPAAAGATPFALSLSKGCSSTAGDKGSGGLRQAQPEREIADPAPHSRWDCALAAYRRAEARVAAFEAEAALLPPARRAFPCDDLEARFGRLDVRRLAALRRLLRLAAPDLTALSLKLDLAIADLAWELDGCESCLVSIQADAGRLAHAG